MAAFRRLLGIGPKSAQRLAYHLVRMPEAEAEELAEAITGVKLRIKLCTVCADITEQPTCHICQAPNRDRSLVEAVGKKRWIPLPTTYSAPSACEPANLSGT